MARKLTGKPPGRPRKDKDAPYIEMIDDVRGLPSYRFNVPTWVIAMVQLHAELRLDEHPKRAIRKILADHFTDKVGGKKSQAIITRYFKDGRYGELVEVRIKEMRRVRELTAFRSDNDPAVFERERNDLRAAIAAAIDKVPQRDAAPRGAGRVSVKAGRVSVKKDL